MSGVDPEPSTSVGPSRSTASRAAEVLSPASATRGRSFSFRIFRLNLVTVFLVGLILTFLFVREQHRQAEDALARRGASNVRALAAASEIGAYGGGKAGLEAALHGALADPEVQYAIVYDQKGAEIGSITPDGSLSPPEGSEVLSAPFLATLAPATGLSEGWEDDTRSTRLAVASFLRAAGTEGYAIAGQDSYYPIVVKQSAPDEETALLAGGSTTTARRLLVGFARVGMTRAALEAAQSRSLALAVIMLGLSLIGATGASFELSRRLAAPLKHLADGAAALGSGNMSQRVRVETADEVGELARAFNRMAANLQDVYQGLEDKVAERTVELYEEKHRLEAVLNTVDEGVIMLDAPGRLVMANRRFSEITGVPTERMMGKRIFDFIDSLASMVADPKAFKDRVRHLASHPEDRAVDMFEIVSPDRRVIHRFSAPVYEFGEGGAKELMGRIEVYRDITRETEIDRMKSEFISTVSHELRTPLTSIKGSLGLILGGAAGNLAPEAAELLNIAQNNSERLIRLINDILDISKIESGKMKLKLSEFDLREVVRESASGIDAFAIKHGAKVRIEIPADLPMPVSADRDRILQILTNLLSNAIKFTGKGTEVVASAARKNGEYRISVSDRGPGIPPEQVGRLFQKFQQVEGTFAAQTGGTGLGLAISKALVGEHGGDIGVESDFGHGSTFWFTLPAPEITAGDAVTAVTEATSGTEGTPRVMVVDDDRDVATLIRMYLEQEGFEVVQAVGGREAIELAKREHFDAITLDLNMPDVSGFEVMRALKDDTTTKDIPVIFVSVSNAEEVTPPGTAAASLAFADWITKPIDPARLITAVKSHTRRRAGKPFILVVDDDPDIQKLLGILLSREGFEVDSAPNGEEALKRVAAKRPDLLILDLVMPGLDGFAVVKRLREQKSTRRIPILILSVKDLSEDERGILNMGTTKFLTKSYASREALLREVVDLLKGAIHAPDPDFVTGDSLTIPKKGS